MSVLPNVIVSQTHRRLSICIQLKKLGTFLRAQSKFSFLSLKKVNDQVAYVTSLCLILVLRQRTTLPGTLLNYLRYRNSCRKRSSPAELTARVQTKDIALKVLIVMPALLLQKPTFKSEAKEHSQCLLRHLT